MRYFPHTDEEIQEMLQVIGVSSIDRLFDTIPNNVRLSRPLNLPPALSEQELRRELLGLAKKNTSVRDAVSFLGGGAYHHYVPSPISQLINRGEFFTAYTPYQPEVSQGTLQALFEYQTMICELTAMEVANASNYDASTAVAEALLMAHRLNKRKKALVAGSLHPQYRKVAETYLKRFGFELIEIPFSKLGSVDGPHFQDLLNEEIGAVVIQSPNFFGVIEDVAALAPFIHERGALLITVASEPLSYALLQAPGEIGADIAVFEGQSFGVGLNFGGPYLGGFATKLEYIRQMPGRVVGQTEDVDGKRGYVLTFSTREQHIRRERATSNICTNQGLCALMATIYLSLMGKQGLEYLARLNLSRSEYLKQKLKSIDGVEVFFDGPTFNEFVIKLPRARVVFDCLRRDQGIFGGILLDRYFNELTDHALVCVTETNTKEQMDLFVKVLKEAVARI